MSFLENWLKKILFLEINKFQPRESLFAFHLSKGDSLN